MKKWLRYIGVILLVLALILVRKFEDVLFDDPFLQYFKGDFYTKDFPDYNLSRIILNILFRYGLNSIISLGIIYLIFGSKKYVIFSTVILLVTLIICLILYIYLIKMEFSVGGNLSFYIRRFLIQPLMLLILVPALFYQKLTEKGNV